MKWTDEEIQAGARQWGEENPPLSAEFRARVLAALAAAGTPESSSPVEEPGGRVGGRASAEPRSRAFEATSSGRADRGPWLRAAAAAILLVGTGAAGFFVKTNTQVAPGETSGALIAANDLEDVKVAERQYAEAISRLEINAGPILARSTDPATPPREAALLAGYRNRLRSVDRAIESLRFYLENNPYHAKTRAALLKTYGEKSALLNAVLQTKRGV